MTINQLFLTVIAQEYPRWHYLALRIVGRPEDAQEVVQTCAVKLATARLDHVAAAELRPYLARCLQNAARDRRTARRQADRRGVPLEAPPAIVWVDPRPNPLARRLAAERTDQQEAL